jgi:hypothetical protein
MLLAKTGSSDVLDAAVVLLAADGDTVLTSDPADLTRLATQAGTHVEIIQVDVTGAQPRARRSLDLVRGQIMTGFAASQRGAEAARLLDFRNRDRRRGYDLTGLGGDLLMLVGVGWIVWRRAVGGREKPLVTSICHC